MFGERTLRTGRKGLQNKIEERAEKTDKTAVRNWYYILKCELVIKGRNEKYQ